MAVTSAADSAKVDAAGIHLFHPIYHTYVTPIRSRIDVDRTWPVHLNETDSEELIDTFSEPPQFVERPSPVTVQFGEQFLKGYNWTELRVKLLRQTLDIFGSIGRFIEGTQQGASGVRIPFSSLSLDPDTLHRVIELDYESGESTYQHLMTLISEGIIAPGLTPPFQSLMPLLSETEIRLIGRICFIFNQRIIKRYQTFLKRNNEEGLVILPFWMPEAAFSRRVVEILDEEFREFCKKERLGRGHLVFLLDSEQADFRENDVLMKSWNLLHMGNGAPTTQAAEEPRRPSRAAGNGVHPAADEISVVFRDRSFSDWVAYANPSVKKLLDRTIAKVDSGLNNQGIHYGWAHFEDLDALAFSPKSVFNFKQKLIKLAELGYMPLSPDFYIRGKLRGHLGHAQHEPRSVKIHDHTASGDWHQEHRSFARWLGKRVNNNGDPVVADTRKFERNTPDGFIEDEAPQGWKLAWWLTRETCLKSLVGNLDTLEGGMAEVLSEFAGGSNMKRRRQNVIDFLAEYTYVYWREHFIQHDLSEADINIHEIANNTLRQGMKANLSEHDAAICGAAAQAIYFAFDSSRAAGLRHEVMDQRGFYQNVAVLTLGLCNGIYVHHWLKDKRRAGKLLDLIKTELIGFDQAYARHGLSKYNIKKKDWEKSLEPLIEESKDNVVKRAAKRVAACHLRPLGYVRDFSREDELITTNVGHIWGTEVSKLNCKYENPYTCGVREV